MTTQIVVTLSSANMGDVEEVDFDAWRWFVADEIDAATHVEVYAVEQAPFGEAGMDVVVGGDEEQVEQIRNWLSREGWDQFCGTEWEARRFALIAAAVLRSA